MLSRPSLIAACFLLTVNVVAGCGEADKSGSGIDAETQGHPTRSLQTTTVPTAELTFADCLPYQGPNPSDEEARAAWHALVAAAPPDMVGSYFGPLATDFSNGYSKIVDGGVEWMSMFQCKATQQVIDSGQGVRAVGAYEAMLRDPERMMGWAASRASVECNWAEVSVMPTDANPTKFYEIPRQVCPTSIPPQFR